MKPHKIILIITALAVVVAGIVLLVIPPAVFPDPGQGFQVLRSMQMGSGFNNFVSPDQSDISQDYTEFLTWWSPGQYLVPYLFKLATGFGLGRAIALTVLLFELAGLAGFYAFFKKVGFTPAIAAISLVFIAAQIAFVVPFVYYNGGELLLFGFEGWFLYGCVALKKPGVVLVMFVLLSGWIGFFCKSSFLWIYAAGLFCLWVRLADTKAGPGEWVKKALWVGVPAVISIAIIYTTFISKGRSPASAAHGVNFTAATFSFPAAAPILSGFSLDDFFHGLFFHFGTPLFSPGWSIVIVLVLTLLSLCLVLCIIRCVNDRNYKLFLVIFYVTAILFFGFSYLFQLNISMEARHLRIIGLIMTPGLIFLLAKVRPVYQVAFAIIFVWIAYSSINYLMKGFKYNSENARGITGIAQPNIDQPSLNAVLKIDRENTNATFVFISNDIGLEILHNRIITLPPIADDLKIDIDDYRYDGFAGPLYIVLPESYNGPREKMIMKSFPDYAGWDVSMLNNNYVLYSAKMKR